MSETIKGHIIQLDEDRSVWYGQLDDFCFMRFKNKELETRVKITKEAMQALMQLVMEANDR